MCDKLIVLLLLTYSHRHGHTHTHTQLEVKQFKEMISQFLGVSLYQEGIATLCH